MTLKQTLAQQKRWANMPKDKVREITSRNGKISAKKKTPAEMKKHIRMMVKAQKTKCK